MSLKTQMDAIKEQLMSTPTKQPVLLAQNTTDGKDELDVIFEKLGSQEAQSNQPAAPNENQSFAEFLEAWGKETGVSGNTTNPIKTNSQLEDIKLKQEKEVLQTPSATNKIVDQIKIFNQPEVKKAWETKNQIMGDKDQRFIDNRTKGALDITGATLFDMNQQRFNAMSQLQQNELNANRTNNFLDMITRLAIANQLQ